MDSNSFYPADVDEFDEVPDSLPAAPSDTSLEHELDTELQISDAVERLAGMDNLRPEQWQALDANQRLSVLQDVENTMSGIQGRPAVTIEAASMESNTFGGFDPTTGGIVINAEHLVGDLPPTEHLDTIIHEGRHAFQHYAIAHPDAVADSAVVSAWAENMTNYLSPDQYGQELYAQQPIEADAFAYAGRIINGLSL